MTDGIARFSLGVAVVATCFTLGHRAQAQAQERPSRIEPVAPLLDRVGSGCARSADSAQVGTGRVVLGAIAGAAAGVGIGLLLLGPIEDGAIWAAVSATTEITLLPLGAHLANRGRGNYALDLEASAVIGAAGILLAAQFGEDQTSRQTFYLSLAAIGQIVTVVAVERRAERH